MSNMRFSDISVKFIKLTFKSRFFMAKTCKKLPFISKAVNRLLFDGDDIQVLPRNETINNLRFENIEINRDIPVSKDIVLPSEVLKEMINRSCYHFIMDFCICRVSSNCKDYSHDLGCLFLGKGVKRISDRLGRVVTTEEAIEHVDKCQDAGLVHIIGRNKIDSIWLNTGPKDELLSICNCCPCCCLWKMSPELPESISNGLTPMVGVKINFYSELCTGCGMCTDGSCFVNAIKLKDKKAEINYKTCLVCGRCAEICENKAITIIMEPDAVDRSIKRVERLVDVESE
jgi:ferredoxin